MLIDVLQELNESRFEKGRGSKAGREKFASKKGTKGSSVKARKSRVKVYDTIEAALDSGAPYGTIFSTKSADRLYVITKPTWGDKSRSGGNTRVAKGFTPGSATPSANWPSIKSYGVRTMLKHGKTKSKRLTAKYGPGKSRPEEKRFAGKKVDTKKKLKEAHCPASKGKLAELLPLLALLKRTLLKKDHTEYEGPSLREKLSYFIAEAKKYKKMKWRPTVSQFGKKLTKGNPKGKEGDIARTRSGLAKRGTVETGKFTTAPGKPIRMKKHKKGKAYDERHPQISYTQDDKGTLTVAHTEYEGPSLSEADFASAQRELEKRNPPLARHRAREKAYPSGLTPGQKQGWPSQEKAYTPEEKEEIQAAIAHLRGNQQLRDRPSDHAMTMRRKRTNSSTEYEGPSLREKKKKSKAPYGEGAKAFEDWMKKRESPMAKNSSPLKDIKIRRRGRTGIVAHTEYEGPTLKEQLAYLRERITDPKFLLPAASQSKGTPTAPPSRSPASTAGAARSAKPAPKPTGGEAPATTPSPSPGATTGAAQATPTVTYGGGGTHAQEPAAAEPARDDGYRDIPYVKPKWGSLRRLVPKIAKADIPRAIGKGVGVVTRMAQTWPSAPGSSRQAAGTEYEGPSLREQLMYLGEARPMVPGRQQYAPRVRPMPQATFTTGNTSQSSNVQRDIRAYNVGAGQQATVQQQELMRKRFMQPGGGMKAAGHGGGRTQVSRTYKQLGAGTEYEGPSLREKIKYLAEEKELTNVERRARLKKRYEAFKKEKDRLDVTGQEHESTPDIDPVDLPLKGKARKRKK